MDRSKLRKKVLLDMLASPWTVAPLVLGASSLLVSWAAEIGGWLPFAGIVGLLAGVGALTTQLVFGTEEATRRAMQEFAAEDEQEQERRLDQLYRRLKRDNDKRDENSLRKLRDLYRQFKQDTGWTAQLSTQAVVEITNKVEKLYRGCIISLERNLTLVEAAAEMNTSQGRTELLEVRERLLEEVRQSIDQLAHTLDEVRLLSADKPTEGNLARIRRELDESLSVARRVEERMQSLESELGGTTVQRLGE